MPGHNEPQLSTPKRAMPRLWSPSSPEATPSPFQGESRDDVPSAAGNSDEKSGVDEQPSRSNADDAGVVRSTAVEYRSRRDIGEPTTPSLPPAPRPTSGGRTRTPSRAYIAVPFARANVNGGKKASSTSAEPARPSRNSEADHQLPVPRYSLTIRELPLADRPRERLRDHGAHALTTAELLAILIRVGNAERSAVSLGEHIVSHFGGVQEVASASVEQLSSVKGIGEAKAAQIKAAIEFGKRVSLIGGADRPTIGSPSDVANLLMSDLRYLKKETLKSVLLDSRNRVIVIRTVSIGDLTSSVVHPREVFKDAVVASSAGIIIAHNHPSGDSTPSSDDINITRRLIAAGEVLGIELLDHIIIGDGNFTSLKERGLV